MVQKQEGRRELRGHERMEEEEEEGRKENEERRGKMLKGTMVGKRVDCRWKGEETKGKKRQLYKHHYLHLLKRRNTVLGRALRDNTPL